MDRDMERFTVLAGAARALSGELDLESVLQTITRTAAEVTDARYCALGVIGPDNTISRFVTHGASEETIRAIGHYPTGKGLLGVLIRDPRVIRLSDIAEHPASYGFPPHHPPMTTFLGAPVRSGGRVFGNLYLTEKQGGEFDETDEQVILILAAQAGAAIESALLSTQLQELAVHDERDRISRELHDGVIQSLFSIGMSLESAQSLVGIDPARVAERLDSAVDAIDGTIRELRNSIFQLRPQQAAAMGLSRGLVELAREYEVNALVRPVLEVPPGIDAAVPPAIVPDILQVVREALSNVAKHSRASTVVIAVGHRDSTLQVRISDDGVGFDPREPAVGRGLENIRERAEVLGASVDIDSAPGRGTTVCLEVLPLGEVPPQEPQSSPPSPGRPSPETLEELHAPGDGSGDGPGTQTPRTEPPPPQPGDRP